LLCYLAKRSNESLYRGWSHEQTPEPWPRENRRRGSAYNETHTGEPPVQIIGDDRRHRRDVLHGVCFFFDVPYFVVSSSSLLYPLEQDRSPSLADTVVVRYLYKYLSYSHRHSNPQRAITARTVRIRGHLGSEDIIIDNTARTVRYI